MDTGYASDPLSWTSVCRKLREDPAKDRNTSFVGRPAQSTPLHQPGRSSDRATSSGSSSVGGNASFDIQQSDIVSHRSHGRSDTGNESNREGSEIFMAIVWFGSRLGSAYYDSETAIVHILLDTVETDSFCLPERLINELQPATVVTSAKQDERFILALRKLTSNEDLDSTEENSKRGDSNPALAGSDSSSCDETDTRDCSLEILPSVSFSYEASKHRIISTNLPEIPEHYEELEREMYMASKIPFDCVSAIRATGGLVKYLEKNRIGVGLEDSQIKTPILDFRTFTLKDAMYIDKSTYEALQIFKKIEHPSAFKMGGGSKEGLSLFGILDRTKSRPGRKQLQQWFSRPITDKGELERRFDAVEYFVHPRTVEIGGKLQDALKHTRKLGRILKQMRTATASVADWLGLYKTVVSAITVADVCRNAPRLPDQRPLPGIFTDIAKCSTYDLLTVVKLIQTIMDKEESRTQNRFVVQPGIDSELDEKKHLYNGLASFLREVAVQELDSYKDYITGCRILYMRRVGYLLALEDDQRIDPDVEIPGLQYMLTSEDSRYYKTKRTRELDANPGDILEEIGDQETTIKHQLQNAILDHTSSLLRICRYVAELDCLISYATVAREKNYVRPEITTGNIVEVKDGRHPLQECTVSLFVPNDVMLGGEHGRIKVITGPNACGKSIYLKQTGLLIFMAQIGSFAPAKSAKIGPINKMYSRIRTLESVSTGMSTFATDLHQMSSAVTASSRNTLVLVDEFGKGTATVDGVSLLTGCLTKWINETEECPFVICSTHFHSLIRRNLLPQSPLLRYFTLETLRDQKTDDLAFLYNLIEGVAECSYAAHIALQAGLPRELVIRGREMTELIRKNAPVRRFDSTSTKSYLNRCASTVTKFLQLSMEDDIAVESFLKSDVCKGMQTPKGQKQGYDTTTDSGDDPTSLGSATRNSNLSSITSDDENLIPQAKRPHNE